MDNKTKIMMVGATIFSCGIFIGFKACKIIILSMVNDEQYILSKVMPIVEEKIGKKKLDRMVEIYYEKELCN